MIFFWCVKTSWDTIKFSSPMWGMWNFGQIGIVRVSINTRPRTRGIRAAHFVRTTKGRNFEYLIYCISTWYAQKREDIKHYLIFAYNFTDKGKSGTNLQRLTSRRAADQFYIQKRCLYCSKRATCFGFLLHLSSGTGITIEEKTYTWYTKY